MIKKVKTGVLLSLCASLLVVGCESKPGPKPAPSAEKAAVATGKAESTAKVEATGEAKAKPQADSAPASAGKLIKYMPNDCEEGRVYVNLDSLMSPAKEHMPKINESLKKSFASDPKFEKIMKAFEDEGIKPVDWMGEVAVCMQKGGKFLVALGADFGDKDPVALIDKGMEAAGEKKAEREEKDGVTILKLGHSSLAVVEKNVVVVAEDSESLMKVAKGGDGAAAFADAVKNVLWADIQGDKEMKGSGKITDTGTDFEYNLVVEMSGKAAEQLKDPEKFKTSTDAELKKAAEGLASTPFKAAADVIKDVKYTVDGNKVTVTGKIAKSLIGDLFKTISETDPKDMMKMMR